MFADKPIDDRLHTSLGYWVAAAFQGKGIVTKCCKAMNDYAITELGMNRVEIRAAVANEKSGAVAKRLIFTYEGTLRQVGKAGGKYLDHAVYSIVAKEWGASGE